MEDNSGATLSVEEGGVRVGGCWPLPRVDFDTFHNPFEHPSVRRLWVASFTKATADG